MKIETVLQKCGKDWDKSDVEVVFEWFMNQELDRCRNFAISKVGNKEVAEDLLGAALLDAFRSLHTYDPQKYSGNNCPFTNWMYVNLARKCSQITKKQIPEKQRREIPLVQGEEWRIFSLLDAAQGEDGIEKEEDRAYVKRLRSHLKPKYDEAIDLYYFQGYSLPEAAKRSKWPCQNSAMKVRKFRAVEELKTLVTKGVCDDVK